MSLPGKKYRPDDGTLLKLCTVASGSELMPIVPSGVTMCATALQTKTMIPPTTAAMMIRIAVPPSRLSLNSVLLGQGHDARQQLGERPARAEHLRDLDEV